MDENTGNGSIYGDLFDVLLHGTVKMPYQADPGLEQLENVYDRSERGAAGVPCVSDMAYYKGSYYCYFGSLPIMAIYSCFYILTGKIPGNPFTMFIFMVFGICFLFGATRKLLEYQYGERIS